MLQLNAAKMDGNSGSLGEEFRINVISPSPTGTPSSSSVPASAPTPVPNLRLRSCVVCRNRKVGCDKQSPCSNCRRANIECVYTSRTDRPPRWARRLERLANNAATPDAPARQQAKADVSKVRKRLRNLESLVKELSSQLEEASAAASAIDGTSTGVSSPGTFEHRDAENQRDEEPAPNINSTQKHFGRLVLQDADHSRYISTGFWSRINDELDGLNDDTHNLAGDDSASSEDEASPSSFASPRELERPPAERHEFLFRHNLKFSAHDLNELRPLPSQIPFLLNVYTEHVNWIFQIVHMPTIHQMMRDLRGSGKKTLTPANESLIFSMYYAAIISMEEDDVMTSLGSAKADLALKYRLGLEHALAKADFLYVPDITVIQALIIFLCLVRRHDSPRFVWMMTGLVIRMAQYLGLQRDGTNFEHLTPFEIETRRRIWWGLCLLDLRASEDQGTDFTITSSSFDTRKPLNINDADISVNSKQLPLERDGLTDMSIPLLSIGQWEIVDQMMAPGIRNGAAGLEEQSRLLNKLHQQYEEGYLKYTAESRDIKYWVTTCVSRLVMAKMRLIAFLPVLFSSPSEHFSDEIRINLLVSAIEVAEYNHALNAEETCKQWRWIFQTYTHWHAMVYLVLEVSRRPWSPTVERAWVALHSTWLIPAQLPDDKHLHMWFPLRKMIGKAKRHRRAELQRLRADPQAAAELDVEDQKISTPPSSGTLPDGSSAVEMYRERWRRLVSSPAVVEKAGQTAVASDAAHIDFSTPTPYAAQFPGTSTTVFDQRDPNSYVTSQPSHLGTSEWRAGDMTQGTNVRSWKTVNMTPKPSEPTSNQIFDTSNISSPAVPSDRLDGRKTGPGFVAWLWADADPSVDVFSNVDMQPFNVENDLDGQMDWHGWVNSVNTMDWDGRLGGSDYFNTSF